MELFSDEITPFIKETHPTWDTEALDAEVIRRWNELDAEMKTHYQETEREHQQKYEAEMGKYQSTPEYKAYNQWRKSIVKSAKRKSIYVGSKPRKSVLKKTVSNPTPGSNTRIQSDLATLMTTIDKFQQHKNHPEFKKNVRKLMNKLIDIM